MNEITRWSAATTADQISKGSVSVVEVVEAQLRRIEEINPAINALTTVCDDALDVARALDSDRKKPANQLLRGVPVTTKSNIDQANQVNSNGVPAFQDNLCQQDSAVAANLRDSGAVIIGRTNTPEFSMRWFTSNPLHGVTKNPWDSTVTPGGSSGGAAASIACGIGAIAHGNDLGGSLRYPAFCCGVATIRPSFGRVPAWNPGAAAERPPLTQTMSVQGPIARSVADVRLGLQAMSQRSSADPLYTTAPGSCRKRNEKIKVGYAVNPFPGDVHHAIETAMQTACDGLRESGIEVVERQPPEPDAAAQLWGDLLFTESKALLQETIHENGSAEMIRLFEGYEALYRQLSVTELLQGMAHRISLQREWSMMFDEVDAFLMPVSMQPPFENDLDFTHPEKIPDIVAAQKPLFVVNLLGLPAVSIPTNVIDGLPVGVQLIAPMHDDWFALDIAERLENEIGTVIEQLR